WHGWLAPAGSLMASRRLADKHRLVTDAVHENGGKIALQVLHAGRYAFHPFQRGASKIKAPINPFTPKAMTTREVDHTVSDFARQPHWHSMPVTTASKSWAPRAI